MGFFIGVEMLNIRVRRRPPKPAYLRASYTLDEKPPAKAADGPDFYIK